MNQSPYCIWIVSPPGYLHSRCFEEVALGLAEAFAALGYDAPIVTQPEQIHGTPIVLGADLLGPVAPPPGSILFNLEQVSQGSQWTSNGYVHLLRRHRVWDYSRRNIDALAAHGVTATLCEIGYTSGLSRIPPAPQRDIDALFVGSMSPRRMAVLQEVANHGAKVIIANNAYGEERDALFARAKLVLNIHYHEGRVLEIVRVSYLLANGIPVVSESGHDKEIEADLTEAIAFAPHEQLASTCLGLLADPPRRLALGRRGFEVFSSREQASMLRVALASLG